MSEEEIHKALEIIGQPITVNHKEYHYFDQENYDKLVAVYNNCLWFIRNFEQINTTVERVQQENKQLKEKVDYLKNKCENKDKWCQLIADIGYDYDGYRQADSLMKLIDELVKYAIWSRDNYDYDAFQEEGNNE